ncbi:MAG: Ku protein [Candidatus Babeliales bacterium]
MKALWKGRLAFGLVNIPIKLYSAIESQSLGFKLLHAKCHTPLSYQRFCPHCKKIIEWGDVIKGKELADGSYFILTKEQIEKMKPETIDVIEVIEFIDITKIDPIYFDSHYYLAPQKVTEKAYFLFTEIMKEMQVTAIGKFVLREKEYVCSIQPYQTGFLLSTLNYAYEIRPISRVEELSVKVTAEVTKQERNLAEKFIKSLTKKEFDITDFKDTFNEELQKQIQRVTEGKKVIKKRAQKAVLKKVPKELLQSLKESIKQVENKSAKARR